MIFWSPNVCHVNTLDSSFNLSPPLVSYSGLPHGLQHPSFQSTSLGTHRLVVLPRHVHRFCFPTLHCSLASCCVPEWFLWLFRMTIHLSNLSKAALSSTRTTGQHRYRRSWTASWIIATTFPVNTTGVWKISQHVWMTMSSACSPCICSRACLRPTKPCATRSCETSTISGTAKRSRSIWRGCNSGHTRHMENQRSSRERAVRRCPPCFVGEMHFRVGETVVPDYERYHEDGRHDHHRNGTGQPLCVGRAAVDQQTLTSSVFTGRSATFTSSFLHTLSIIDLRSRCPCIFDVYVYVV